MCQLQVKPIKNKQYQICILRLVVGTKPYLCCIAYIADTEVSFKIRLLNL